jgi:large subunit ribosomal protein L10
MRQDKQLLLDELKDQMIDFQSFVVMQYLRLSANKANAFRREVTKMGGTVEIMRKRVLIKAAQASGVSLNLDDLPGHIGLVYTKTDPIEMTKFVLKFSQENEKSIAVIAGRFDGVIYNAADVEMLSKLPNKNEMRAELLGTFEAPMAQTLAVMEALIASVVYCLDNKCQLEQESSE